MAEVQGESATGSGADYLAGAISKSHLAAASDRPWLADDEGGDDDSETTQKKDKKDKKKDEKDKEIDPLRSSREC